MLIPKWKMFSGWTKDQLNSELANSRELPLNHPFNEPEQADPRFYQRVCSEAIIGFEKPGAPLANEAFSRAWEFVKSYRFSDPIQVEAFFQEGTPLHNRCLVLEIKALGLNFLGSVRITETHESSSTERTCLGYRYDTLDGHPENGSEWFILEKNHGSGELKFKIASSVRSGTFPNWWTRVGYGLVGKTYRDRWHRQSYRRLQKLLGTRLNSPIEISNSNCTVGFEARPALVQNS